MKDKNQKFFSFVKNEKDNFADLYIYGEITKYRWDESDVSVESFKKELDELGEIDTLNIYINSPGGSVFEGINITNMLIRHKAKKNVYVDALAASIASIIAIGSADILNMYNNSMIMIHNPWTIAWGSSKELRKTADDLDKMRESLIETYMNKSKPNLSREKLIEMLDNETWLTAKEASEYFNVNIINEEKQIAASINKTDILVLSQYKHTPDKIKEIYENKIKEDDNYKNDEENVNEELKAKLQEEINSLQLE